MIALRRLSLPLLILALLAAGSAAASGELLAELRAPNFEASGPHQMDGSAVAFLYGSADDTTPIDFGIELQAGHIHLETDHSQSAVGAAGASVEGYQWTDQADYANGHLVSSAARPHFKAQLVGPSGLSIVDEGDCLAQAVPVKPVVEVDKFAQSPRPAPSTPTAGTVQATLCGGTTTIRGTFTMTLYEVDVEARDADGSAVHTSGEIMAEARGPEGTGAPVPVQQTDQIYLNVTDGELRVVRRLIDANPVVAFLSHANTNLSGRVQAAAATGKLYGERGANEARGPLELAGDLLLTSAAPDSGLIPLRITASPVHVGGDGATTVAAPNTSWHAPAGYGALLATSLVLLLLAGLVLWHVRTGRRRGVNYNDPVAWRFHYAVACFNRRYLRLATHFVDRALHFKPRSGDLRALKASICYERRKYDEAVFWAEKADNVLVVEEHRARNSLVGCLAEARRTSPSPDSAGCWYFKATSSDPTLADRLERDQPLQRLSQDPAFLRWLTPKGGGEAVKP